MKLLIFISLFGGLLLASCGSSSSQKNASTQEVNPADTIYLGDLREKFEGDSIFFKVVAPDLMLMDYPVSYTHLARFYFPHRYRQNLSSQALPHQSRRLTE